MSDHTESAIASDTRTQPEGRSMKELRAIVAAEMSRYETLHEAWNNLTEEYQVELVRYAQSLVAKCDADEKAVVCVNCNAVDPYVTVSGRCNECGEPVDEKLEV